MDFAIRIDEKLVGGNPTPCPRQMPRSYR